MNWNARKLDSPYRIGYHASTDKHEISELRLTYLHLERQDWSVDKQQGHAAFCYVSFHADKRSMSLKVKYVVTFSLHAIARFYQRSRDP